MTFTLIVEPNPGGHRFEAVAGVARLAGRTSDVALLTLAGARERDEYRVHLADLDLTVVDEFAERVPAAGEMVSRIVAFCREHPVDTVVIMDGDTALMSWWRVAPPALRTLGRRPRILYFLTRYPARLEITDIAHWRLRIAKGALLALAMSRGSIHRASGFAGRDERARGWLVKRARDPAVCSAHSRDSVRLRAELGLAADRKLVGIFGGINVRKNPKLVLEAVLRAGPEVDLLMAGPVHDEIRPWLDGLPADQRARVIVADGFLPNDVLDQYLASADVVALVMELEGPSGIQGKALAAGVPVVSAGSRTRARELAATAGGIATDFSVTGVAGGLRRALDGVGRPAADAGGLPMPTPETFAATILGVPLTPDAPAAGPTARTKAVAFARRVRNKLARTGLPYYLRPVARTDLVRLGSDYGGWWIPDGAAKPGSVAYCAGAGEDITFDLALHERGCAVTTFDPTPRAIAHVEREAPDDIRFRFEPVGWWDTEAELKFYSPQHHEHVSHSVVNLQGTSDYFVAMVKPVRQLMAELGDDHVDIVKMDIEGAEYNVLDSLLTVGPTPPVLCLEFDQPAPLRRTVAAVRRLQRAGYTLNKIDGWNYTFTR